MPITRTPKLILRLTPQAKQRIAVAADQLNRTVNDFVLTSALERADEVLAEQRAFRHVIKKWEKFQAALEAPLRDISRLRRLMQEPSIFEK
jgi:uncharacterized protein (DUF1778 family)